MSHDPLNRGRYPVAMPGHTPYNPPPHLRKFEKIRHFTPSIPT